MSAINPVRHSSCSMVILHALFGSLPVESIRRARDFVNLMSAFVDKEAYFFILLSYEQFPLCLIRWSGCVIQLGWKQNKYFICHGKVEYE